jgi:uncharacterized membrane protein
VSAPHTQAKRPVSAWLAGPYGHPFHPILVTIPIGAWVTSLIFDLGSQLADDPGPLAEGARWLMGIGVLGALLAAMVGLLDFFTIPGRTRARRTALLHMVLNLTLTGAYTAQFFWRPDHPTSAVGAGPISVSAVSLAVLAISGYLGGELVFRYGIRVAGEDTQLEGFTIHPAPEARKDA